MKTQPVKGTKDFLPIEQDLRENIRKIIEETYINAGFNKISTPILEDLENLNKSDGGDNLNLIFKILKRGDKLDKAINEGDYDNLSDLGLRYDLTLPLTRFYANNKENLPKPFKSLQIDRVYRADRPQNGRMREFYQCDIDILGSNNLTCEVELILTTMQALNNLGLKNLTLKINDRKLLNELLLSFGYNENELLSVCVILDKLDKIGINAIIEELNLKGLNNEKLINFLNDPKLINFNEFESKKNLDYIISTVKKLSNNTFNIEFDITLVRGQSYYTGTVFEVYSNDFSGAIAGGGRYDNLIGKFIEETVPAVGFSIGFERICNILTNNNIFFNAKSKIAVFYDETNFEEKYKLAQKLKENYIVSLFESPKKFSKFLDKLVSINYSGFIGLNSTEIKFFKKVN